MIQRLKTNLKGKTVEEFIVLTTIVKRITAENEDAANEMASDLIGELPVDDGDILRIDVFPSK